MVEDIEISIKYVDIRYEARRKSFSSFDNLLNYIFSINSCVVFPHKFKVYICIICANNTIFDKKLTFLAVASKRLKSFTAY